MPQRSTEFSKRKKEQQSEAGTWSGQQLLHSSCPEVNDAGENPDFNKGVHLQPA